MVSRILNMVAMMVALLVLMIQTAAAANISAQVDRNPVGLNESFTLTLEADAQPDASPDLSVLEQDFDVLNRSQSTSMQVINGSISQSINWRITLMAKRDGDLQIPAIAFGSDRSSPVDIKVLKVVSSGASGQSAPVELVAELEPSQGVIGQQLLYTLRLYFTVPLTEARMEDPQPLGVEAVVKKLGDDRQFTTLRNGTRVSVLERRFAIFPQQQGTLQIPATQVIAEEGRRSAFISPFAQGKVKRYRKNSEAFNVNIKPMPDNIPSGPWLPARGLRIKDQWSGQAGKTPRMSVGDAQAWIITMEAEGLESSQLPPLQLQLPPGLKAYPDQPVLEEGIGGTGIQGIRTEKIAIVAEQPGHYTLPEVVVPWWNITTGRMEESRLPARTIEVLAVPGQSATAPPQVIQEPKLSADEQEDNTDLALASHPSDENGLRPWQLSTFLLLILWLSTLWLWWRVRSQVPARHTSPAFHHDDTLASTQRALLDACRKNAAKDVSRLFNFWFHQRWSGHTGSITDRLRKEQAWELLEAYEQLNRHLYAQKGEGWDGKAMFKAIQVLGNKQEIGHKLSQSLAQLHPSSG